MSSIFSSGILEMCHRDGKRNVSYSPATPQNGGHGVEHSPVFLPHQEAAMGLINCLIIVSLGSIRM